MDIVHHSFIGAGGFLYATHMDQPLVGAAFVAASVFPDLDVVFMALGKRFYLKNHQAISHSLPLAPVYALLLAWPLIELADNGWNWMIYLGALCGFLFHVCLDWFNTFRIALFSPFKKDRYSLDAVFFIDTFLLTLTGFYLLLALQFDQPGYFPAYITVFSIYCALKLVLQRKVKQTLGADMVVPSAFNPLAFFVLTQGMNESQSGLYNAITKQMVKTEIYPMVEPRMYQLAQSSQVFRDMQSISRALRITDVERSDEGTTIKARDVALRNFGGRFARTTLKFDDEGSLISEVANI